MSICLYYCWYYLWVLLLEYYSIPWKLRINFYYLGFKIRWIVPHTSFEFLDNKAFWQNVFSVPFISAFNYFLVSLYNCLSLSLLEWFAINLWLSFFCCKTWMFKSAIHGAGGRVSFICLSGACWFIQVRVNSFSMYGCSIGSSNVSTTLIGICEKSFWYFGKSKHFSSLIYL